MKKIIFLGRKAGSIKTLNYLIESGLKIILAVADRNDSSWDEFVKLSKKQGFTLLEDDREIYRLIEQNSTMCENIDLVISYLFWKKIKQPLINLPKIGCVNFHPAPLPDYKGRAGYNTAILDNKKTYGVSAHFIDSEKLDNGPIIKVLKFQIEPHENVLSLYKKSQDALFKLFKKTIPLLLSDKKIRTVKNSGGLYLTKKQLEDLKTIDLKLDTLETINKKIRAFFFPPYSGAKIRIQGEEFTLVNNELLEYLSKIKLV